MQPEFWLKSLRPFDKTKKLNDLGFYKNWTRNFILKDKQAVYKGIPTDKCLEELLDASLNHNQCFSSSICYEMMLSNRIDTGYLLTHRLIYVMIMKNLNCQKSKVNSDEFIRSYCTLMLKEAKTNEHLGFPQRDIFLEQGIKSLIIIIKC